MTAREAALKALIKFRRSGDWSEQVLYSVLDGAVDDKREAALCSRIVYGCLQNSDYLDHYIGIYSSTPPAKLEPQVLDILRLSAYQLLFMDRVPPSAAVSEGVRLCKKSAPRASGLCNAVLRRIAENREKLPEIPGKGSPQYLATRYSHPLWLSERLVSERGYEFTEGFFAANNEQPPLCLQVNTLRTSTEELEALLLARGLSPQRGETPGCLLLPSAGKLTELPEFAEGLFYIQDEAARRAVIASGAKPGMTVLDACAAPGGKSFAAAIAMGNEGRIISRDLQEKKLRRIEEGAARLGISIIQTSACDARVTQAELAEAADLVIADVPCSGLGVIRKKPEIRRKQPQELSALPEIQLAVLEGVAPCVKRGGTLLYSTCTVLEEENEKVVDAFLARHGEYRLDMRETLWPHIHGTDGFFICRLIKSI